MLLWLSKSWKVFNATFFVNDGAFSFYGEHIFILGRGLLRRDGNLITNCVWCSSSFLLENASAIEYKDLISELKILIHIGQNDHIVNLLAACTKGI